MKKRIVSLFLAVLLLLLCACGEKVTPSTGKIPQGRRSISDQLEAAEETQRTEDSDKKPSKGGKSSQNTPSEPKTVEITELISQEDIGIDMEGSEFDYSYHVPQIQDDTPAAEEINREIESLYGEMARMGLASVEQKNSPEYSMVTYEVYRSGSMLSLVICTAYFYAHVEEYDVYCYDTEQGVRLTSRELLERYDMTDAQAADAIRCAVVKASSKEEYIIWRQEGRYDMFSDCRERISWTLAKDFDPETPLYSDESDQLHAVVSVGTVSESGILQQILPLVTEKPEHLCMYAKFDDLFALENTEEALYLSFLDTPAFQQLLKTNGCLVSPEFDKNYLIHGLFLDYASACLCYMDSIATPYMFLLTKEGEVGYVDVAAGLQSGYFCAAGPVLGLPAVTELRPEVREDGCRTVYAHCENGEILDLYDVIFTERCDIPTVMASQWDATVTYETDGGGSYDCDLFLTVEKDGSIRYSSGSADTGYSEPYHGTLTYAGMTEDGMVFTYNLWYADGSYLSHQGAFALTVEDVLNEEYGYVIRQLKLTELSGTGLIYTDMGKTTEFIESYG